MWVCGENRNAKLVDIIAGVGIEEIVHDVLVTPRLEICQIFYTKKIKKNQFHLRKTRKSRQFWPKIKNGGCFTHSF